MLMGERQLAVLSGLRKSLSPIIALLLIFLLLWNSFALAFVPAIPIAVSEGALLLAGSVLVAAGVSFASSEAARASAYTFLAEASESVRNAFEAVGAQGARTIAVTSDIFNYLKSWVSSLSARASLWWYSQSSQVITRSGNATPVQYSFCSTPCTGIVDVGPFTGAYAGRFINVHLYREGILTGVAYIQFAFDFADDGSGRKQFRVRYVDGTNGRSISEVILSVIVSSWDYSGRFRVEALSGGGIRVTLPSGSQWIGASDYIALRGVVEVVGLNTAYTASLLSSIPNTSVTVPDSVANIRDTYVSVPVDITSVDSLAGVQSVPIEYAPSAGVGTVDQIDYAPALNVFSQKFPFSIPWDIYRIFSLLNASPQRPCVSGSLFGTPVSICYPESLDSLASIIRWGVFLSVVSGVVVKTREWVL